jgi:hypothetical protein
VITTTSSSTTKPTLSQNNASSTEPSQCLFLPQQHWCSSLSHTRVDHQNFFPSDKTSNSHQNIFPFPTLGLCHTHTKTLPFSSSGRCRHPIRCRLEILAPPPPLLVSSPKRQPLKQSEANELPKERQKRQQSSSTPLPRLPTKTSPSSPPPATLAASLLVSLLRCRPQLRPRAAGRFVVSLLPLPLLQMWLLVLPRPRHPPPPSSRLLACWKEA